MLDERPSLCNTVRRLHTVMIILTVLHGNEQMMLQKCTHCHRKASTTLDTSCSSKRATAEPSKFPRARNMAPENHDEFKPMPICLKCFHKSATNPCSLTPGREASHCLIAETWWSIPAGLYVSLDSNVSLIPFLEQSSMLRTTPLCQRGFLRTKTLCCPGHSTREL